MNDNKEQGSDKGPDFPADALELASQIELVVFDVDGVLTDGKLYYTDAGQEMKAFQVQDGAAIKLMKRQGIEVAIITGRDSTMVARRAGELDVTHLYQGIEDKSSALRDLVSSTGIEPDRMAHVGDDLPDLALFELVRLAICVPNGHPVAMRAAGYVTKLAGGHGVAREVCQLILTAKDLWPYR